MDASVETALAAMRKRYVETSRGIIASLDLVSEGLLGAPGSDDLLTLLRRELHRVRGTAGSLGFHEASSLAGAMEGLVRRWHDEPALDLARRSTIVRNFSSALRDSIGSDGSDGAPTKRLVLLALSDPLADAFVAEAMHRGVAVARVNELATTDTPWALVAMERAMTASVLAAADRAMCFVLRDGTPSRERWPDNVHLLEANALPADIINALANEGEVVAATRGRVLIVDDDPMMLMLLEALAEGDGFSVVTAAGGEAFREHLAHAEPTMLVFDVELDGESGIDLLRAARLDTSRGTLPVLMLSGRTDTETRGAAFAAGADDYMVKPVAPAEFQQRLGRLAALGLERVQSALREQPVVALVHTAPDVVVVEDDPTLREMLAFALDARGLSHIAYATGPEALEGLLAMPPSDGPTILLLDIDLPGMDGHSLHERLRVERPGAFQVVFISLHTGEADQLRALKGGALDYLVKPISLRVLIAKLDVWRERMGTG